LNKSQNAHGFIDPDAIAHKKPGKKLMPDHIIEKSRAHTILPLPDL
jgi:hypothetical protein